MIINYNIKMNDVFICKKNKFIVFTKYFINNNIDIYCNKFCDYCHNENIELFKCAGCKCVYYCSKNCQKLDWKEHKEHCKAFNERTECKKSKKICMFLKNAFQFSSNVIRKKFNVKKIKYWELILKDDHIRVEKMNFENMEIIKKQYEGLIEDLKEPSTFCIYEKINDFLCAYKNDIKD